MVYKKNNSFIVLLYNKTIEIENGNLAAPLKIRNCGPICMILVSNERYFCLLGLTFFRKIYENRKNREKLLPSHPYKKSSIIFIKTSTHGSQRIRTLKIDFLSSLLKIKKHVFQDFSKMADPGGGAGLSSKYEKKFIYIRF